MPQLKTFRMTEIQGILDSYDWLVSLMLLKLHSARFRFLFPHFYASPGSQQWFSSKPQTEIAVKCNNESCALS